MGENNTKHFPSFDSLDQLVDYFDSHDLGEYAAVLPEADFDISLEKSRHLVAIDEQISSRLTEIAEQEHVPAESLINDWLREKISSYPKQA